MNHEPADLPELPSEPAGDSSAHRSAGSAVPRLDPSAAQDVDPSVAQSTDAHDRDDLVWLQTVYQGDTARQLSVRSIVTGMIIGAVMSVSNLYVGLKTGWGLGVTVTSCIIAYAVFRALEVVVPAYRRDPFTILENYTMSSAASAAGYMASAGLVSAIPALYLVTGRQLTAAEMMSWLAAVSLLGVFMAVPLKRQLINIEKLPFPEGIATAETLKSMHTAGAEALSKARSLLSGAVLGALVIAWKDGFPALGGWLERRPQTAGLGKFVSSVALQETMPLAPADRPRAWMNELGIGFEGSVVLLAAGAIMGIRVGLSLLVGAVFYYAVLGPRLIENGWAEPGKIVRWTLWPATALLLTSGLLSFAMRWRTVLRAFRGLGAILGQSRSSDDPLARIEVPASWFVVGAAISGTACVVLGHTLFEVVWWTGIVAVAFSFILSLVAARATGETSVTPIGAMGKITQLLFGVLAPANTTANLMAASITAGSASHSADLLTDLKCGYLLGGNPRKQTISQLFGVLAGTLVCVPVYAIVVDPEKLGTSELPAPAAAVWASVARLLSNGLGSLPPGAATAIWIGGALGILITLAEEFLPARYQKWVPSATGLGIAGVVSAANSISMFLGALAAWLLQQFRPQTAERYTIPFSSGLIAGESLMAVSVQLVYAAPAIVGKLSEFLQAKAS